jgi:YXWGXW repeat-containing protein
MNVKRTVIGLCFALSAGAMPSAFARVDVAVGVGIGVPPPAPYVEYVPPPRYGYVWAPGYWAWRHDRHVWVRGHWVVARPGYYWVPDRWVHSGRYWRHERGHWAHRHGHRHYDRYAYRY